MKPLNFLSRHFSDLLVYLLVPMVALFLPAPASRALVRWMSGWQWLLAGEAHESLLSAEKYIPIANANSWKQRWRLTVILEVRDLGLLMWGRRNAVFSEIAGVEQIEQCRDRVLIGMHWGPSIAILSLLESRGMKPLLVFRPVERSIFRVRPWYYLFLVRSVCYIEQTCGERAITIKGAGAALKKELPLPGTSVVVLDAPPAPGRSTIDGHVVGHAVKFNAGFPEILEASGREYHFYAISLVEGPSALRILELTSAKKPESREQLIGEYCSYLGEHIRRDSAQWRIWQVAGQFFQTTAKADKSTGQPG